MYHKLSLCIFFQMIDNVNNITIAIFIHIAVMLLAHFVSRTPHNFDF